MTGSAFENISTQYLKSSQIGPKHILLHTRIKIVFDFRSYMERRQVQRGNEPGDNRETALRITGIPFQGQRGNRFWDNAETNSVITGKPRCG